MNKEIKQICQKIDYQKILNKDFYPSWFFTNEKLNEFLIKLDKTKKIERVFAIAGGNDFVFNLLSLFDVHEVDVCDKRPMSCLTTDFKIALFKEFDYEELLKIFLDLKSNNKEQIYKRVRDKTNLLTQKVFDYIFYNCKHNNFTKCLQKSRLWYRESLNQINNKEDYLFYFISREKYQILQARTDKINIYCGDFVDNLKLFDQEYFDAIYLSNILDSKDYNSDNQLCMATVKDKLSKNGSLFIVTQGSPKKTVQYINDFGFTLLAQEIHHFNVLSFLLGHYSYSFLLFQNK